MNMQPYLDKLKAKYDKLKADLAEKKADLEIANQKEVSNLENKLEEMKLKMAELQDAGDDKMEELKGQVDEITNDIETGWNNLLDKLKA